jgi:DNA-binding MarR family transcriptional regulator
MQSHNRIGAQCVCVQRLQSFLRKSLRTARYQQSCCKTSEGVHSDAYVCAIYLVMDPRYRLDLRDDIPRALYLGAVLLQRHLASNSAGLSLSARAVLATLADDGPTRLTGLATAGGITQPAMTQLVGRLERNGLVVRLIDPDDGRATLVDITDAGRALLAQLRQEQRDNLAELLKALSPDDETTLSLAMRVALPLLEELRNVAENNLDSNVSAPRQASVRAW